jgi:HEAT repeat protein
MHISEVGLCGGHSSSGVWVDENAATTVPGLYAAGDLACVPHNYMIGAFVFGDLAGANATAHAGRHDHGALPEQQLAEARELIYRPLGNPDGPPQQQVEYKLRRFVNDYVAPPKTGARLAIALETFGRMRAEIAAMGARTPHELMRCAEVTFIRDCAELAVRASLARTESRWGLYHDRADLPDRDDAEWFWHLNIRRGPDGDPELLKRAVSPYIVDVPEFEVPVRQVAEAVIPRRAVVPPRSFPERMTASSSDSPSSAPPGARSPRLLELVRLAENQPALSELRPFLSDPNPRVRRAAIAALTESAPPGAGIALAEAANDASGAVRHAAVAGLRELTEVLTSGDELLTALCARLASPDPAVRAGLLDVLTQLRAGDPAPFAQAMADPDHRVRLQAVRGLASTGQQAALARAVGDTSRDVRIAAAEGLAALADTVPEDTVPEDTVPEDTALADDGGRADAVGMLAGLARDRDPLVRAAAFKALAPYGCPPPLDALAADSVREAAEWEVRAGAARALAAAAPSVAVAPLAAAAADPHADVRKAAVIALSAFRGDPAAEAALGAAGSDTDADVRAYAVRAGA